MELINISDDVLFGRVEALAQTERFTLVDFLVHLGELDRRPACQNKGYSSVFAYLTRHLGYSESDAARRLRAARAARQFPSILKLIAAGRLHLVGVATLEPVLTRENHEGLLRKASGLTTRAIERMVADISPAAVQPKDRIRALPAPIIATTSGTPTDTGSPLLELSSLAPAEPAKTGAGTVEPSPRVVFTFSADESVRDLFERARDLLRHKFPAGAMEEVIGEALRRLVDETRPGTGPETRPAARAQRPAANASRYIPKWIEDHVWRRDGGRCAFVGQDGRRCGETAWLELDHVTPWAIGGRSTDPDNIRLLCRAHNQSEARRVFGAPGK